MSLRCMRRRIRRCERNVSRLMAGVCLEGVRGEVEKGCKGEVRKISHSNSETRAEGKSRRGYK